MYNVFFIQKKGEKDDKATRRKNKIGFWGGDKRSFERAFKKMVNKNTWFCECEQRNYWFLCGLWKKEIV